MRHQTPSPQFSSEREGAEEEPTHLRVALWQLTRREWEVLHRLTDGDTNGEIAAALVMSLHTVKTHVRSILQKMEAADRHEARRMCRDLLEEQKPGDI